MSYPARPHLKNHITEVRDGVSLFLFYDFGSSLAIWGWSREKGPLSHCAHLQLVLGDYPSPGQRKAGRRVETGKEWREQDCPAPCPDSPLTYRLKFNPFLVCRALPRLGSPSATALSLSPCSALTTLELWLLADLGQWL